MKIFSFPGQLPRTPLFAAAEKAASVLREAGYCGHDRGRYQSDNHKNRGDIFR